MPPEVMTVEDLAEYLKLNRQTIYRKFRRGELPGIKIGRSIRFKRDVIDVWLRVQSRHSNVRQREKLLAWGEQYAKERGITEEDVIGAVRAHRRSGR
jgi:excisionase family DNA binding protein